MATDKTNVEVKLTYDYSTLIRVEVAGNVVHNIDIIPRPYWEVCWASGWSGDYASCDEAVDDCYNRCGYNRSVRKVEPGDPGYKDPEIHQYNTTVVYIDTNVKQPNSNK